MASQECLAAHNHGREEVDAAGAVLLETEELVREGVVIVGVLVRQDHGLESRNGNYCPFAIRSVSFNVL